MIGRVGRVVAGVVVLAVLAGCSGGDDEAQPTTTTSTDPRTGTTVVAEGEGGEVVARSQGGGRDGVVVDEVTLERPGFVAVLADGNGAPGEVVGVSEPLEAGTHRDVEVAVEVEEAADVFVVPFVDVDGDGTLGWPEHDEPVGGDAGVVLVRVRVEP